MRFVWESLSQALYRIFHGNPALWDATERTLVLAGLSTAIALLIGLPLGLAVGLARPRRRRFGFTLANAGLGLPPVTLGIFLALVLQLLKLAQNSLHIGIRELMVLALGDLSRRD